jgi:hypothetical protein
MKMSCKGQSHVEILSFGSRSGIPFFKQRGGGFRRQQCDGNVCYSHPFSFLELAKERAKHSSARFLVYLWEHNTMTHTLWTRPVELLLVEDNPADIRLL